MIRHMAVGWTTLALLGLLGSFAAGQDQSAAELYGRGVHAYFAGDMPLAIGLLSESIEKNPLDPRAYYFRGLAMASQSGIDAGRPDFAQGAEIEFNKIDRHVYDINAALQRVQGYLRLEIEKQRTAARKAAAELKKKRDRVRYEELKRREDIVLFNPNRPAPEVKLDLPKTEIPASADPFASGTAFTGGKQVDYVAPEPVEPSGAGPAEPGAAQPRDPFAGSPKPSSEQQDPFATPAKQPDNPFGGTTPEPEAPKAEAEPDAVNPFGDNMPAVPPQAAESGPGPPAAGSNLGKSVMDLLGKTLSGDTADRDPFADPEEKGAAAQQPKPPVADADPFGGSGAAQKPPAQKPAAPAADADPFGGSGTKQEPAQKKPPADNDPFK